LPKPEEDLLEALVATGKPVVLVLTNGSALAVNWAKGTSMQSSMRGIQARRAGRRRRNTLRQEQPAGRLPVTFYTGSISFRLRKLCDEGPHISLL